MLAIDYLKLQAKNLFRDYKTKKPVFDSMIGNYLYEYTPKYFDINGIVSDYDIDEDNFSLMNAQHIIAHMVGFRKWTDLIKATNEEVELAKLLFDNQHKIGIEDWKMYIVRTEYDNKTIFDPEEKLEIFKEVFVKETGHRNPFPDYRLNPKIQDSEERQPIDDDLNEKDLYEEASLAPANNDNPIVMVECLHCGEQFLSSETKLIKLKGESDDGAQEVCKHWPECDGRGWDFLPVEYEGGDNNEK
jgi:hypothetical protein